MAQRTHSTCLDKPLSLHKYRTKSPSHLSFVVGAHMNSFSRTVSEQLNHPSLCPQCPEHITWLSVLLLLFLQPLHISPHACVCCHPCLLRALNFHLVAFVLSGIFLPIIFDYSFFPITIKLSFSSATLSLVEVWPEYQNIPLIQSWCCSAEKQKNIWNFKLVASWWLVVLLGKGEYWKS